MPNQDDLKKATGFTGGIKFGGGDTGFEPINQPGNFGVKLTPLVTSKTIRFPKGTSIYGWYVTPGDVSPGAGTVDAGPVASPAAYMDDIPLSVPNRGNITVPVKLAVDTDVIFVATGLVAGEVYVSL